VDIIFQTIVQRLLNGEVLLSEEDISFHREFAETLTQPLWCPVASAQRYALSSIRSILQLDAKLKDFVMEKVLIKVIALHQRGIDCYLIF